MATNPRRKSNKSQKDNTEETVTDIETTEAEAPEAPAAEAKEAVDHEGNLYTSIIEFAKDNDVAKLQETYRAVPAASRGRVQGAAMKRAMVEVDMDVLGQVLDAWSNLPTATKTRTVKPEIDSTTAGAIRLVAFMRAFSDLQTELGSDAATLADRWFSTDEGVPSEHKSTVDKIAEKLAKASTAKGGSGGPRNLLKESVKDLVERGALPVGAELLGPNGATAEITADGKIAVDGNEYEAPSAAAKAIRPGTAEKPSSLNGWDFWTYEGQSIGSLRTH